MAAAPGHVRELARVVRDEGCAVVDGRHQGGIGAQIAVRVKDLGVRVVGLCVLHGEMATVAAAGWWMMAHYTPAAGDACLACRFVRRRLAPG